MKKLLKFVVVLVAAVLTVSIMASCEKKSDDGNGRRNMTQESGPSKAKPR
jgi:hypothetical protein